MFRVILTVFSVAGFFACSFAGAITLCPQCEIKQLKTALEIAKPYDTLYIKQGIYTSINETIEKPITIIGINRPVLDGKEMDEVLVIRANHVSVIGIDVRNSKRGSMKDYAGIRVFQSSDVKILDCRLANTFFAIYLSDSKNVTVRGNRSKGANFGQSDSGNGVHLWKCDSITIEDNHLEGHRDGIYFEFAKHCLIRKNYCRNNFRYGLHFMFSDNDTYVENTFDNNGTGVAVMYSKGVHMFGNHFINNWGDASYGLLLKDISNSEIQGNTFTSNTIGVFTEGSNRIRFEKNDFLKNGYALKVMANCQQDTFWFNNFSGNTFDVGTNGNLSDNFFGYNYWDKYQGYDLDKNKIGDVPYQPISLFSVIIEQMPYAVMLLRSFTVELLDRAEKMIPSLVPETIQDKSPLMSRIPR
ncbi:MAG: nitrous oxide reductase family maturation protein NosD [Bacteroidetes bacterium]|nr:nitrous oxide reductase family maturation protein NosD [Bacteroidota bacterium]